MIDIVYWIKRKIESLLVFEKDRVIRCSFVGLAKRQRVNEGKNKDEKKEKETLSF